MSRNSRAMNSCSISSRHLSARSLKSTAGMLHSNPWSMLPNFRKWARRMSKGWVDLRMASFSGFVSFFRFVRLEVRSRNTSVARRISGRTQGQNRSSRASASKASARSHDFVGQVLVQVKGIAPGVADPFSGRRCPGQRGPGFPTRRPWQRTPGECSGCVCCL